MAASVHKSGQPNHWHLFSQIKISNESKIVSLWFEDSLIVFLYIQLHDEFIITILHFHPVFYLRLLVWV